jgi:glyoxylase-like metal-dependent hydrolase (beta-lactamase superfamily II)
MSSIKWIAIPVLVLAASLLPASAEPPIARDLELEALQEAGRWPKAEVQTVMTLAGRFMAARRDAEALEYFRERAAAEPARGLFLALEGLFQARRAGEVSVFRRVAWVNEAIGKLDRAVALDPGLSRYLRGVVLTTLPARFGKASTAVEDLRWMLDNKERFPVGLRRGAYAGLASAYTTLGREAEAREALARAGLSRVDPAQPVLTLDGSLSARDGFRFRPRRIIEPAPGVHVAQGFDFGDIAFVSTEDGLVAIDAGTTEDNARTALAALRRVTDASISHVILTHAHWDHVGGVRALVGPGTRVIAQAAFADELRLVNGTGVPFRYFFGTTGSQRRYDVAPDHLVRDAETLTIGGTRFGLHPVRGGETADALLVHLPDKGVLFVGDVFMPYLGAPFVAEGSADGLFEAITTIRSLEPRVLVHGHPPLTDIFRIEVLPALETAVRELHRRTRAGVAEGRTLVEILHQNILPATLRETPAVVLPYLVMRNNFVSRVYHQSTGYWKPDGEGLEVLAPAEWAAALDLLGGGRADSFARSARTLLARGDDVLALKLTQLALLRHPADADLTQLRRQALDNLRVRYQQLNPFKFIIYSEWAGAELAPVE